MSFHTGDVVSDYHGVRHVIEYVAWMDGVTRPVAWCERWHLSRNLINFPDRIRPPTCFWCVISRLR